MVLNFAVVIGQTLGVKLVYRFSYNVKFIVALIPLVLLMIIFPVMIELPS